MSVSRAAVDVPQKSIMKMALAETELPDRHQNVAMTRHHHLNAVIAEIGPIVLTQNVVVPFLDAVVVLAQIHDLQSRRITKTSW